MAQPSEWAKNLRMADQIQRDSEKIKNELRASDQKMFLAKAPEYWQAILEQLKADCGELDDRCYIVSQFQNQIVIRGRSVPIRTVGLTFNIDGHFIKLVKTYSNDGADENKGGIERIYVKLQPDELIAFVGEFGTICTVQDLVPYLMRYITHPND
jgi:hypothetical protein